MNGPGFSCVGSAFWRQNLIVSFISCPDMNSSPVGSRGQWPVKRTNVGRCTRRFSCATLTARICRRDKCACSRCFGAFDALLTGGSHTDYVLISVRSEMVRAEVHLARDKGNESAMRATQLANVRPELKHLNVFTNVTPSMSLVNCFACI